MPIPKRSCQIFSKFLIIPSQLPIRKGDLLRGSILKKWAKIESKLNSWLENLSLSLGQYFNQLFKRKVKISKPKAIEQKEKVSKKELLTRTFINLKQNINKKAEPIVTHTKKAIGVLQSIDVKKMNSKLIFGGLIGILGAALIKLKVWYIGLRPESILVFTVSTTVFSLASINIYKASKEVYQEAHKESFAEEVDQLDRGTVPSRRPAYYKMERLQFSIQEINFPVTVENLSADAKTLLLDVDIQTSNRYVREYLYQNEHLIKDILSRKLRPVVPSFPLEDEGKFIIKDKIKDEINLMLDSLGIDGKVDEVMIVHIIAA